MSKRCPPEEPPIDYNDPDIPDSHLKHMSTSQPPSLRVIRYPHKENSGQSYNFGIDSHIPFTSLPSSRSSQDPSNLLLRLIFFSSVLINLYLKLEFSNNIELVSSTSNHTNTSERLSVLPSTHENTFVPLDSGSRISERENFDKEKEQLLYGVKTENRFVERRCRQGNDSPTLFEARQHQSVTEVNLFAVGFFLMLFY